MKLNYSLKQLTIIDDMNVLVIGIGNIGRIHLRNLQKNKKIKIFVNDTRKLDLREKILKNTKNIGLSKKEIIENKIDFALICTPSKNHFQLAKKLISLGIPVLIEKPMVLKFDEFRSLEELGKQHNVFIMCGFVERHHNAITFIKKELIDQELIYFESKRHSIQPDDSRILDSVKFDTLIHDIDILNFLNPDLNLENLIVRELNETALAIYNSKNFNASLTASRISQNKIREITLMTKELQYVLDLIQNTVVTYSHNGVGISQEVKLNRKKNNGKVLQLPKTESIMNEQNYFFDSLSKGFDQKLFDSYKFSHFSLFSS